MKGKSGQRHMFGGLAGRLKTPARISGDAVIHPWGVTVSPPNF